MSWLSRLPANLLKYLYNINPSQPMTALDRAALPMVTTLNSGGTLVMTYRQYKSQTNLTIHVQKSTDLVNWQTAGTPASVRTDAITSDPIMQLQVTASGPREYLRLRVSSP